MSSTTDEAAAAVQTNRQARAAFGIAADSLRLAYAVVDEIRPSVWDFELEEIGDGEVRTQARDLLDRTNAYIGGIYATIRDNDEPFPDAKRGYLEEGLRQAESNLRLLEGVRAALVQTFLEDLEALITAIGTATVESVRWVADKAKTVIGAVVPQWVWWIVGGAAIVGAGVYAWRLSR